MLEAEDFSQGESIDKIVVVKKERKMYLYKDNKVQNTLPVSLGKNPVGAKQQEGDNKTPEGEFWISRKLCSPKYYRSLCISYPRPEDKARAAKKGLEILVGMLLFMHSLSGMQTGKVTSIHFHKIGRRVVWL